MNIRFLTKILAWITGLFKRFSRIKSVFKSSKKAKKKAKHIPKAEVLRPTYPNYHKGCFGNTLAFVSTKRETQRPKISDSLKKTNKNKRRNIRRKAAGISYPRPFRRRKVTA
jgi:hypothetical protein